MSNTNNENNTLKKAKKARVIPGFGLTMGGDSNDVIIDRTDPISIRICIRTKIIAE